MRPFDTIEGRRYCSLYLPIYLRNGVLAVSLNVSLSEKVSSGSSGGLARKNTVCAISIVVGVRYLQYIRGPSVADSRGSLSVPRQSNPRASRGRGREQSAIYFLYTQSNSTEGRCG